MKKQKRIPDCVVYDQDTESYNAKLLPYPTNLSSPVIYPENSDLTKQESLIMVTNLFEVKFQELIGEYQKLQKQYEINKIVLSSKYSFIPKIGNIYHLYESTKDGIILSIIEPTEWDLKHLASVRLSSNNLWELM